MGSSLSSRGLQPRPKEPGTLVLALTRFIEKGTMHLDVNQVRAYASLPPAAQLTFSPPPHSSAAYGRFLHHHTAYYPCQGLFGLLKRAGYEVGAFGKVTNDQAGVLKKASEVTF